MTGKNWKGLTVSDIGKDWQIFLKYLTSEGFATGDFSCVGDRRTFLMSAIKFKGRRIFF